MFWFSSVQDYTDATMVIAQADQGGFALPDRDYYLTDAFKGERADYRAHLARMFGLLGDGATKAEAEADATMRVETALAKAAMGLVERREPKNVHHKTTLAEFAKLTPSFDWTAYLARVGAPAFTSLDVSDPGFFKGLEASLKSLPSPTGRPICAGPSLTGSPPRRRKRSSTRTSCSSKRGSAAKRRSRRAGSAASP